MAIPKLFDDFRSFLAGLIAFYVFTPLAIYLLSLGWIIGFIVPFLLPWIAFRFSKKIPFGETDFFKGMLVAIPLLFLFYLIDTVYAIRQCDAKGGSFLCGSESRILIQIINFFKAT